MYVVLQSSHLYLKDYLKVLKYLNLKKKIFFEKIRVCLRVIIFKQFKITLMALLMAVKYDGEN